MDNAKIKGWTYHVYPGDISSAELGPFQSLVDLWRAKSGENALPTWRDFEFEEFSLWWGRLSLANVLDNPFDIKFPLWGTILTDWWGVDYTNKKMETVYQGRKENWEKFEGPYIRALIENQGVGIVRGDLRVVGRSFLTVQGVDLPLLKDGRLTQILSGYCAIERTDIFSPSVSPLWKR